MAPPATKRRKLSHSPEGSGSGGSSSTSFAGFNTDSKVPSAFDYVETDGGSENESSAVKPHKSKTGADRSAVSTNKAPQIRPAFMQNGGLGFAFTGEVFRSSLFKLQIDELLEQIRSKQNKQDSSIDRLLRSLKSTIEAIPSRGPASVVDAEKLLTKRDKVVVPFPDPRPPKDANYKLQYARPAHINTVGSYPLNTATKYEDGLIIDLTVTMPPEIFQEKDYLNYRYFYKRAYYLACLAAGIQADNEHKHQLKFECLHGNPLLPVLVVEASNDPVAPHKNLRLVILPTIAEGQFPREKLLPNKNNVRSGSTDKDGTLQPPDPTPFYNASLRADGLVTAYLKLQHDAAQLCEGYKDACILGRVWLRQRGFNGRVQGGGFGNFEWAATIALLLQGGGPNGKPAFSPGYNSYQLFKATLQYFASKDLVKTPQFIGGNQIVLAKTNGVPTLLNSAHGHNITFKMTPWSYRLFQHEARSTVAMLNDTTFDHFDAAFILKADHALCRYDINIEVPVSSLLAPTDVDDLDRRILERCQVLYSVLKRGLMDRVTLISLHTPTEQNWKTDSASSPIDHSARILVGLVVDPTNVNRLVDHGPPGEDVSAAKAFVQFWGEKAELRRFKDGSIVESLVWSNQETASIFRQVVSHLLARHFGEACSKSITYVGDQDVRLLALGATSTPTIAVPFQPMKIAFKSLESDIRGLNELPLQLRHVLASDSQLSSGSIEIPFTPDRTRMSTPADVVIQFEGSARWPDDIDAIQRTKIAFLLKLAELLEAAVSDLTSRLGLENQDSPLLNKAFLDIIYPSGAAFRLRIHHDREATLLERRLKDKTLSPVDKTESASALATYKRNFIRRPALTQAMQMLCTRFPALSPTVRMVKKWISSHLLSPYFSSSLIELLAVRAFTNPYPWPTPSSANTGFLRTLVFLSRWDWRSEPWIVDLGAGDMKAEDVSAITTRFEAWRKIDPALNRVVMFAASNIDADGTTWTDHTKPPKVIAARITALATAAVALLKDKGLALDLKSLFVSNMGDYDILIRLNPKFTKAHPAAKIKNNRFKNLQLQLGNTASDSTKIGYNSIKLFLQELEDVFGQALVFFYDECGGDVIAALWNPQTEKRPWKLKLGYSTKPAVETEDDGVSAVVNKGAILNEIARLGGDLVLEIDVKGT